MREFDASFSSHGLRIHLRGPRFSAEFFSPKGWLVKHPACLACFYYYMLATNLRDKVGESIEDQIVLEGEPWHYKRFAKQKRAVAKLYGVDPADMDKFWPNVTWQCRMLGLPLPAEEIKLLSGPRADEDES